MAVVLSDLRNHLEGQLAAKKTALNETEESLRKYVGDRVVEAQSRPAVRNRITGPGGGVSATTGRGGRRSLGDRLGGPDGEERPAEEDVVNKSVMSRVVKDVKSREETIEEQKNDNKVVARNRRMFGALVGTLQKFNKEEIKKKDVLEKKKVVEKNVEEKVEKEKEEIKNKKRELFYEQKKKKKDIQIIQIQMKRVEEYEIWEKSKQFEGNFIRTKAEPDIFWLPKNHSEKTKELVQNTKETVAKEIELKKEEFEEELLTIERKLSLDQDRSRNGGTGDIRDRLGKVKNPDDSLEAGDEEEEEEGGFMSDRRVVERERENETNGADLRMTLKNDLAERIGKRKDGENEGRHVIVKSEAEVEERRKRKEEEKQKEEERRIRHEEEKRREEKKKIESSQNGTEKPEVAKAEQPTKRKPKARDASSDDDEKSKRDSGKKRKRAKSGRSSKKDKKSKHESSDSDSSSEDERRPKKRASSSSNDSEEEKSKMRRTAKDRKRAKSNSNGKDKKRSKRESSSEESSSDSD